MTVHLAAGDVVLHHGDALEVLATLPDGYVDTVVTSPPYFGLRDYGYDGQIGLEDTPAAFVARLVEVFREVRRVLAPHGVCWVNMGDSYAHTTTTMPVNRGRVRPSDAEKYGIDLGPRDHGVKPKDLLGIPWRLAFALQDDGWWLRSDVVWHKPNPMPESVTDRPTKAHEYLFLLTKAPRYYWDAEGVREDGTGRAPGNVQPTPAAQTGDPHHATTRNLHKIAAATRRNVRTVWTFPTEPNPEAHFATFPRELVRRCLAAGCPERVCATCGEPSRRIVERDPRPDAVRGGGWSSDSVVGTGWIPHRRGNGPTGNGLNVQPTRPVGWTDCGHGAYRPGIVLDPFMGSGTTAVVARAMSRHAIGIDGSAEYLAIAERRLAAERAKRWVTPGPKPAIHADHLTLFGGAT